MTRFVTLIIFIILLNNYSIAGTVDWQEAVSKITDKVVLIEYYEQISSPESILEKGRVKKHLTGILVNDSGLIMTSSSIFKANLEFTSVASIFDLAQMPAAIRVKFQDQDYKPAIFIGKDDDKKLAFIELKSKPEESAIKFNDNPDLKLVNKILIIQHLTKQYDYALMVNERLVNAIITKPHKKYLCENNLKSLSGFGLVLNSDGEAIGILQSSQIPDDGYPAEFHDFESNEPAEISLYSGFKGLIASPPVFKEKETARKKWLGIYMQSFKHDMAQYYGNEDVKGVLINTVLKESPAEKAGLLVGDVVTSVNDLKVEAEKISDLEFFRKLIRKQKDPQVLFEIFRDGRFINIQVTLGDTPISQFLADEVSNPTLGLSVKELTQDIILAKQLELDTEGVWVSKVERAGWADIAGLQVGDLILKINDKPIGGLEEIKHNFDKIEKEKPEYLSLFVKRRANTRFLFIKTNFEN